MTTKERIVEEALTLFSTKGYHGTSVKDIALAVGIKDSSLYKHFRKKQEIFDIIIKTMQQKIGEMSLKMGLPSEDNLDTAVNYFGYLNETGLLSLSREVFLFYLTDPFIARFRKMAIIEQYQKEEVYQIYYRIFMEDSISYLSGLFQEMINQKFFRDTNPMILSMSFYTPIFFLLCKYDQTPERVDEACACLDLQIKEFYRIYHI